METTCLAGKVDRHLVAQHHPAAVTIAHGSICHADLTQVMDGWCTLWEVVNVSMQYGPQYLAGQTVQLSMTQMFSFRIPLATAERAGIGNALTWCRCTGSV